MLTDATQTAGSRNLITLSWSEEIEVRTSGYANFADDMYTNRNVGTFIGVVNQSAIQICNY